MTTTPSTGPNPDSNPNIAPDTVADEIVDCEITDVAYGGDGVGRLADGMAVFVPFTAVGDKLRVRIVERQKRFARGVIESIVEPGRGRNEPKCPVYGECGGCRYQHLTHEEQLDLKRSQLADCLTRIGKIEELPAIEGPEAAPLAWGYRNKISLHLTGDKIPERALAYHGMDGHTLVPVTDCPLARPELNDMLRDIIASGRYREFAGGPRNQPVVLRIDALGDLVAYRQPPSLRLTETVSGRKIHSPAGGFHQVNSAVLDQIADWIRPIVAAEPPEAIVDMYCGVGLFTVLLGDLAKREVLGVESHPASTKAAAANAKRVGIERFHCETGRTEDFAAILLKRAGKKGRTIAILDPPRQGCQPAVTDAILEQRPDLLIYVSCNPSTLARDLKRLGIGENYTLSRVGCFDMFPQTAHLESVAVLTRIGGPPDRTWKPPAS